MDQMFTNIAGGAFQPYVARQIENRKTFIQEYNTKRENKHLIYFNNRNSWIKLTSCVDVDSNSIISKKYNLVGPQLAQKYILQGGIVSNTESEKGVLRYGIGDDGMYGTLPNKPLGFKPMPGITSISLSSAGKLGTLQYADITFVCYDIGQLELMDTLYMKLGFTLILEWGHTNYLDDDNKLITNPSGLDIFSYTNKENLLKDIQSKRVSTGANYDGMIGTVSNFGWEAKSDGSYECNIKLVGAGDILDSLKINHSISPNSNLQPSTNKDDKKDLSSKIADKSLSILNQALFLINERSQNTPIPKDKKIGIMGLKNKKYKDLLNKIFEKCPYYFLKFDDNGNLLPDPLIASKGNQYSLISGLEKNPNNIPNVNETLFNVIKIPYEIMDLEGNSNNEEQVYISLGNLLALMTTTSMIFDTKNGVGTPYLYIDFNDNTNFCATFKGQVSLDPRVCIIPRNQDVFEDPFKLGLIKDKLSNDLNGGNVSYGKYNINSSNDIKKVANGFLNTGNGTLYNRARLMHIMLNITFLTDTLKQLREKNKNSVVNLSEFLNIVLDNVSKSLGGFNEFRLLFDDSNKCLRIIDDNRILSNIEFKNNYTELDVFGLKSLVYSYNFKSKIGPNMASMVTISAQAKPNTLGDDTFAISNLSRGLTDRLITERITPNNNDFSNPEIQTDNFNTIQTHLKDILGHNDKFIINIPSIDPSMNIYKELIANYKLTNNTENNGTVIIPLEFSINMDGISGIIPNSAFIIPSDILPSSYKDSLGNVKIAFIIHKINQEFNNNKWITSISGQTISISHNEETFKQSQSDPKTPKPSVSQAGLVTSRVVGGSVKIIEDVKYKNGELPDNVLRSINNPSKFKGVVSSDNGRIRLYNKASIALDKLLEESIKDGIVLKINSAYRNLSDQVRVKRDFGELASTPGRSNHGFGLAVDFSNESFKKISTTMPQYVWLSNNASKFGFRRIPSESWHWEYQI